MIIIIIIIIMQLLCCQRRGNLVPGTTKKAAISDMNFEIHGDNSGILFGNTENMGKKKKKKETQLTKCRCNFTIPAVRDMLATVSQPQHAVTPTIPNAYVSAHALRFST
jgi:hypothetical protein